MADNTFILETCFRCERKVIGHGIHKDCDCGKFIPDSKVDSTSSSEFLEPYYCHHCEIIAEASDRKAQKLLTALEQSLESEDAIGLLSYMSARQKLFLESARVVFNRHASASDKIIAKNVALALGVKSVDGYSLRDSAAYIKDLLPLIEKKGKATKMEIVDSSIRLIKVTLDEGIECK